MLLYTVSGEFFKDIHTGFSELVCAKPVEVIEEDVISSVLESIQSLEKNGFIKLYYYPEKLIDIPKDDGDLTKNHKKSPIFYKWWEDVT